MAIVGRGMSAALEPLLNQIFRAITSISLRQTFGWMMLKLPRLEGVLGRSLGVLHDRVDFVLVVVTVRVLKLDSLNS